MHSWISLDLIYKGKLLRSQLNSQIFKYLQFLSYLPRILTRLLYLNCPCRCITLRARKALRVIYDNHSLGAKRLPGAEPPAGPPKFKFAQFSCTNPKFPQRARFHETSKNIDWANNSRERASLIQTLALVVLALQNFPGPLAFRISNCDALTPSRTLFAKIWPQGREIFKILWNNFRKRRHAISTRFVPSLYYKMLL